MGRWAETRHWSSNSTVPLIGEIHPVGVFRAFLRGSDGMDNAGMVVGLQIVTTHGGKPHRVHEVRALVDYGLEGDIHGKKRAGAKRQVLILDKTVLTSLGLQPGDLREQITVEFPALDTLPAGALLRMGQVTFELTGPCDPCTHIGGLLNVPDPESFERVLEGRRGQLARVVAAEGDGMIRLGDAVVPISSRDDAKLAIG